MSHFSFVALSGTIALLFEVSRISAVVVIRPKGLNGTISVSPGTKLVLKCIVKHSHLDKNVSSMRKVHWHFKPVGSEQWIEVSSETEQGSGFKYILVETNNEKTCSISKMNVTAEDAGVYQCFVQSRSGEKDTARVRITVQARIKPRVVKYPTSMHVPNQDNLPNMTTPDISRHNGFMVSLAAAKNSLRVTEDTSILLTCTVVNISESITDITWRRTLMKKTAAFEIFHFELSSGNWSIPEIDSVPTLNFTHDFRKEASNITMTLSISNFTSCDHAEYSCEVHGVSTVAGDSILIEIDTPSGPENMDVTPTTIDWSLTEEALLTCQMDKVRPVPEVTWIWRENLTSKWEEIKKTLGYIHVHPMTYDYHRDSCTFLVKRELTLGRKLKDGGNFTFSCRVSGDPLLEPVESPTSAEIMFEKDTSDPCSDFTCFNGGTCHQNGSEAFCRCVYGFSGKRCEKEVRTCESKPCANQAECIDTDQGFSCRCKAGYVGKLCRRKKAITNNTNVIPGNREEVLIDMLQQPVFILSAVLLVLLIPVLVLLMWLIVRCHYRRNLETAMRHINHEDLRVITQLTQLQTKPSRLQLTSNPRVNNVKFQERAPLLECGENDIQSVEKRGKFDYNGIDSAQKKSGSAKMTQSQDQSERVELLPRRILTKKAVKAES